MDIINKILKKVFNRILVGLAGIVFIIAFIIFSESLELPTEFYINWIGNNFVISILLFGALLILVLWLLGVHLNCKYNKYLKNLSPEERKREKENCKMANEIVKYICEKYGDDHNLELVDVVDKKDKYNMIYREPKNPQKIKVSFNRKSKAVEESLY